MLSLRTMLDSERAEGIDAWIGFAPGAETYLGHLTDGKIEIARGRLDRPTLIFHGEAPMVAAAVYGGQPLADLEAAGMLRITGDRALAENS